MRTPGKRIIPKGIRGFESLLLRKSKIFMDIFNLSYKNGSSKVYFLSLHVQGKVGEREIIIKFIWNRDKRPQNFWDKESNISKDTTNIDHLSFHKDGSVLLTYNDPKKNHFHEKKLAFPLKSMPENSYISLIIFSVNIPEKHSKYIGKTEVFDNGNNTADLTWDNKNSQFSVACFLVRSNFETRLLESKFPGIFDINNCALFPYAINQQVGLLFAFSKKIALPNDYDYVNPKYRKQKLSFDKIPVIGMSIISSDDHILRLSNYQD